MSAGQTSAQTRRILVAEDEQVVAMDVEAELSALGYQVVGVASTGLEALHLAETAHPDLVLMDIQLEGPMDGITAANEIRRCWQIPVVFVTSFANEEVIARAKTAGAYGYLTKPFRNSELNATVAVALHQHGVTRELFQEHDWLRTLLEGMHDGVIATDAEGRVKYLNPIAESLTGWILVEALGQPVEQVYPLRSEDNKPEVQCQLRRVLASGQQVDRERFLLTARGRTFVVEASAAPIRDAQRRITGAVAVIVDVTERDRAERERERLMSELKRSNAELARYSHAVSHDLQTPIRTMSSFAKMISQQLELSDWEAATELARLIVDGARSMQRLVESLLRYAQINRGELRRASVLPAETIAGVCTTLTALISEHEAKIQTGALPPIYADEAQFAQLIQNLITNSILYCNEGRAPEIMISSESTADGWKFAVTDNGRGILSEYLTTIFEPLKRLGGDEIPGSGIGLALCRAVVERHGGSIWAESAGPGTGTTITFTLKDE